MIIQPIVNEIITIILLIWLTGSAIFAVTYYTIEAVKNRKKKEKENPFKSPHH